MYEQEYKFPGREDAERAMHRYRGLYHGRHQEQVKLNGSGLLLSGDAASHLENICQEIGVRFKAKKLKQVNGK